MYTATAMSRRAARKLACSTVRRSPPAETLRAPGTPHRPRRWLRAAPLLLGAGLAAWLLAPHAGELSAGLAALIDAQLGWLALAVGAALLAYAAGALALQGAVPAQLCYRRATQVQLAAASVTAFAPAGLASLAVNARYLERIGVPRNQALAAVTVARLVALLMHLLLLAALTPALLGQLGRSLTERPLLLAAAGGVAAGAVVAVHSPALRVRLARGLRHAHESLRQVAPSPRRLWLLVIGSFGITAARALTLYASLRALGAPAPLLAAAGLFLAAEAAGAAATTPAGLGVLDGIMLTGLAGLGVAPASAIAAVVLFRLLTFWAPMGPGAVALYRLRRVGLL